ncbi:cytochrome P450 [Rhodopirellula baltica]|uniref:Cytochrome P450 n=1 Tax=Rhodopirellula baltica SWK14 TaxID=993516 RepID=L7CB29_RHOBT|nr:cytochrome P450 [Rhodopirellula baltica]ELP31015.1 Cytochrome P450 [Rhodopirellula baltica SWK14]
MRNGTNYLQNFFPGYRRLSRLPKQFLAINPFAGDCMPSRVPLLAPGSDRPTQPFPHRWNYEDPVRILETYFWKADEEQGPGRHNRYLDVPGFAPVLVTRDPGMIRAIATATGDREGQFDRDTLPSVGIARATGTDTLLYANGAEWKKQRKIAACPFGKTTLFQPEQFCEFADTFRETVRGRIDVLRQHLTASGKKTVDIQLEPEVKVVMLEMLTNNFFGANISYEELREKYVPALERVIDHIVKDTVKNRLGVPWRKFPSVSDRIVRAKADDATFEELTQRILVPRGEKKALWKQFKSDAPDAKLISNLKVFLAGALEATTSYATWAISHLARHPDAQEKVFEEVKDIDVYTPEILAGAKYLRAVLDETLRLTPSLYFLPRRATADTWVTSADGRKMFIPWGTHLLLDVWHANRHEDHWGVQVSGYPANEFEPDRWRILAESGRATKDTLHFGFGHGPRVCPGKHLGELEVGLTVGALVKTFRFQSESPENLARAGVSTKPADGTRVSMSLRSP